MPTYEQLAANIAAVEKLGDWIAKSGMFGVTNPNQGFVIACDLFITGMPVMEYQKRNMLIQGNPSLPYDAMIAAFQEDGGKIKVVSKTPELAAIELTYQGETTKFSLSWEDAQKEPFVYAGNEKATVAALAKGEKPELKSKYATPRSRAIMLYARCVSDGIRTVAAKVNFGTYTPEEIEDFTVIEGKVAPPAITATAPPSPSPASKPAQPPVQAPTPPLAPSPPVTPGSVATATTATTETQANQNPATPEQRETVVGLMRELAQLGQHDIQKRVVAKLEANGIQGGVLGLTFESAKQLIKALGEKNLEAWAEAAIQGHVNASKKSGNA